VESLKPKLKVRYSSSLSLLPLKVFCLKVNILSSFISKAGYVTAFALAFPPDIGILLLTMELNFYLDIDKKKCSFGYLFGRVTL
jgi:hypothetical protein